MHSITLAFLHMGYKIDIYIFTFYIFMYICAMFFFGSINTLVCLVLFACSTLQDWRKKKLPLRQRVYIYIMPAGDLLFKSKHSNSKNKHQWWHIRNSAYVRNRSPALNFTSTDGTMYKIGSIATWNPWIHNTGSTYGQPTNDNVNFQSRRLQQRNDWAMHVSTT